MHLPVMLSFSNVCVKEMRELGELRKTSDRCEAFPFIREAKPRSTLDTNFFLAMALNLAPPRGAKATFFATVSTLCPLREFADLSLTLQNCVSCVICLPW